MAAIRFWHNAYVMNILLHSWDNHESTLLNRVASNSMAARTCGARCRADG